MDDFDNMSDEDIQQLMALGIIPEKQQALQGQFERANMLRDQAMQAPQMRGNYRVQTAANPLEFLASGMQAYKQGRKADQIQQQQMDLLNQQAAGRNQFYQHYFDTPGRRAKKPFMQDIDFDPNSIGMPQGNY
jgi:hypothetical protein